MVVERTSGRPTSVTDQMRSDHETILDEIRNGVKAQDSSLLWASNAARIAADAKITPKVPYRKSRLSGGVHRSKRYY